jgi:hypothetical protein
MSTTPATIKAFLSIGFTQAEIDAATPWHGNALVFPGNRYVAYFPNHGGSGWQVAIGTKAKGRVTLYGDDSASRALSWGRGSAEKPEGQACKQGYRVDENGVEKGRKVEAETPVVSASSLDQAQIDKAQLLLRLAEKGFTRDEIMALIKA